MTRSWRSNLNLLFLSLLFTFLVLGGVNVSATELDDSSTPAKSSSGEGILGTVKHIYKVAVNGPDPNFIYEKDAEDGIERLTDDNYVEKVQRPLALIGERKDDELWVVLVHGKSTDAASNILLDYHKQASDLVKADPELENVKFARLDYITAWKTCTRWLLNRPPYLIFISSSGRQLRFVPTQSLGKEPERLYKVIKEKMYEVILPWDGRWSPTGDRSYLIEYYIRAHETISKYTNGIPNWMILAFTGIVTQQLMSWLHGPSTPARAPGAGATQVRREERVLVREEKRN
ncbi:hypothetical protein L486_02458 [Kwoniella mangroviensis CBS 10435]|uniref:Thioredoxin-like fold domain-containing protein n=1 Tax=Kwoniella mangroviensis CBS 10435 TaxID=1331196 RepID=A0A1B9IW71_9TREE|nr:hypothetical protein L486_02458 [Kwoniella mangroviensis CBS 10435]